MKLLPSASCLCALTLLLGGCQSLNTSDLQSRLAELDFDLTSASYIARAGETLESIAYRYNTTEARLRQLNPAAANGVYTGMELYIRQPSISQSAGVIRDAGWSSSGVEVATNSVRTSPTLNRQAVPLVAVAPDSYLLSEEPPARNVPQRPQILPQVSTGYVEQPGFPVEEVIEDENFVIPSTSGLNSVNNGQENFSDYGGWQWPLRGQLARDYDPRRPNGRGIEIVGIPGDEVRATRSGVVDWVARSPDGVGKVIIIRHDDDYLSIYSNAQDLFVSMNDTVEQGDPIASLGANANDEPLLRFEISKDGNLLNPMDFLTPR